ncbi:MAG: hypothetical protein UW71_C0039G0019 [Parcubacteria group bacterium GW2011_GWB1_44_7]|nr:MAG: hypothetical protein UW71_C0039G0019 [Parcubacteria group bacterium GW2011_GWB1_44_7]
MKILPLHPESVSYLEKRRLLKKFQKQTALLLENINHPSLNVELLEPKQLRFFSFRVDKKYRAIFIFTEPNVIEIIDINNHYHR